MVRKEEVGYPIDDLIKFFGAKRVRKHKPKRNVSEEDFDWWIFVYKNRFIYFPDYKVIVSELGRYKKRFKFVLLDRDMKSFGICYDSKGELKLYKPKCGLYRLYVPRGLGLFDSVDGSVYEFKRTFYFKKWLKNVMVFSYVAPLTSYFLEKYVSMTYKLLTLAGYNPRDYAPKVVAYVKSVLDRMGVVNPILRAYRAVKYSMNTDSKLIYEVVDGVKNVNLVAV
ncbi:MAG: hypothetical protein DRO14_00320 [Thermoprotei archaeon]|nr:MAG: hypothetical protein DRO14_00115 [Thermoprotei archaeon]RLG78593.1 MAG: hypothetical protein DRO14_00320 [Thermoprotei archaeon]